MQEALIYSTLFTLVVSMVVHHLAIKAANRWDLVDIPTSRRRHPHPMPVIGGVPIFLSLSLGITFFCIQQPEWFSSYKTSLLVLGIAVALLVIVGLIDDLRGLSAVSKLLLEFGIAAFVIMYEPRVHSLCVYWSQKIGILIYFLTALWIVGLTNATNLIDGIDGLACGTILLVAGSIAILSSYQGVFGEFGMVSMIILIPSLAAFLVYNWFPAKIFLGDNGSLPLGFLVATIGLMCPPTKNSTSLVGGLILMMGYPILDTGLCAFRRFKDKHSVFKADRNHLHHRLLRLGLSVPQAVILLFSITAYLQLSALCINLMPPETSALYIAVSVFGLFSVIYLLQSVEYGKTTSISILVGNKLRKSSHQSDGPEFVECTVANIDLKPLYEVGLFEEKERVHEIVSSLKLMLRSTIRAEDILSFKEQKLSIVFINKKNEKRSIKSLRQALDKKLKLFQEMYNLQYSMAGLKITFETQDYMVTKKFSTG